MNAQQEVPVRSAVTRWLMRAGKALSPQFGQSLYEVALLTPLLLTMLVGVVELGRYSYISILVANAARAGAAYGSQSLPQSATNYATYIQAAATNDFQNNGQNVSLLTVQGGFPGPAYNGCTCEDNSGVMNPDPATDGASAVNLCTTASTEPDPSTWCPAGQHWVVLVSVEAKGTFASLFRFIPSLSSITIDRTSTLRVNQQ